MIDTKICNPSRLPGRVVFSHRQYSRRKLVNASMLVLTGLICLLALFPLFWIIGYVVLRGVQSIDLAFITQTARPLGMKGGGVLHAIEGSIITIVMAIIIAIPPGLLAAFYAAYRPNTPLGVALRFGTDVLSGVPSIVIGIFVYALVVKNSGHYSALAGSIALAILMIPTVIRTAEEMIKLVPGSLREGSLALGAAEWRTAFKVTLPAALHGIVTGIILSIARAAGETAPLLFTALGNERFEVVSLVEHGIAAGLPLGDILAAIIQQPVDSLPLTLFKYVQQPYPERVSQAWGVALVLMALVLFTNLGARLWVHHQTKQLKGS